MAKGEMTVKVSAADLSVVRANVRALDIVIGLIGSGYPQDMMRRFINECVDLKQDGMLDANMMYGVQYIGSVVGAETYQNLVEYLAERIRKDDELAPARKQAGVKTAARVAAAGKKTVAQTRKKATGAADGK